MCGGVVVTFAACSSLSGLSVRFSVLDLPVCIELNTPPPFRIRFVFVNVNGIRVWGCDVYPIPCLNCELVCLYALLMVKRFQ